MPEIGADHAIWAMSNGEGRLLSDTSTGTIQELAKAVDGRKSIVVLPGDSVLLAEANLPGNPTRAQQAIPYALEDQVADDIEDLHFAIGRKDKGNNYPVAIINRDTMETLHEQFEAAGLRPTELVPEILALPKLDPAANGPVWSGLLDADKTVVRLNGNRGFATDSDTAELMLSGAGEEYEEEFARGILLYRTDPALPEPEVADLEVETQPCDSRLQLYASGLSTSPRINLLQGDFSYRQQINLAWKPWRWSMVLAGVLMAIFAGSKFLDYQRFTTDLAVIAAAFQKYPQSSINSIGYRPGRYDLDVSTDALPTLDKLKTEIEQPGTLTMKVQSARRQKDVVRSTIRLESAK